MLVYIYTNSVFVLLLCVLVCLLIAWLQDVTNTVYWIQIELVEQTINLTALD